MGEETLGRSHVMAEQGGAMAVPRDAPMPQASPLVNVRDRLCSHNDALGSIEGRLLRLRDALGGNTPAEGAAKVEGAVPSGLLPSMAHEQEICDHRTAGIFHLIDELEGLI